MKKAIMLTATLCPLACQTVPQPYGIGMVEDLKSPAIARKLARDRARRSLMHAIGMPIGFRYVQSQGRASIQLDTTGKLPGEHRMEVQYTALSDGGWLATMYGTPRVSSAPSKAELVFAEVAHDRLSQAYSLALQKALRTLVERHTNAHEGQVLEGRVRLSRLEPRIKGGRVQIRLQGEVKVLQTRSLTGRDHWAVR